MDARREVPLALLVLLVRLSLIVACGSTCPPLCGSSLSLSATLLSSSSSSSTLMSLFETFGAAVGGGLASSPKFVTFDRSEDCEGYLLPWPNEFSLLLCAKGDCTPVGGACW